MKKTFRYFLTRLKGHIKSSPVVIAISLLTALTVAFLAIALVRNMVEKEESENKLFTIGITGDMNQRYLGLVFETLNELDDTHFFASFEIMDEAEAEAALRSGDILGYLIIPDGFVDAAAKAEFIHTTYVSEGTDTALGDTLIAEFIKVVEDLADNTQKGVFGAEQYYLDRGIKWRDLDPVSDGWTLKYVAYLLGRSEVLDIRAVDGQQNSSIVGYYFSAFALLFSMLFGIGCASHLVKKDFALPKLLSSRRIGAARQVICENAAYFVFSFVFMFVIISLGGAVLSDRAVSGVAGDKSLGDFMLYAASLAPALLMIFSAQILLYELVDGVVSGVLLQFTAAISTSYITGLFYPSSFFPTSVQKIASVLPGGVAFSYAKSLYAGSGVSDSLPLLFAYTALFIASAIVVRKIKTGGDNA